MELSNKLFREENLPFILDQEAPKFYGKSKYRIHNIGLMKTGSTSISGIFENYSTIHEFQMDSTIDIIYSYQILLSQPPY